MAVGKHAREEQRVAPLTADYHTPSSRHQRRVVAVAVPGFKLKRTGRSGCGYCADDDDDDNYGCDHDVAGSELRRSRRRSCCKSVVLLTRSRGEWMASTFY